MSDRAKPFIPNPVLGGLMGLGPLAVAARSLADGIVLGLGAALSSLALGALLPALRSRLPERFRAPASLALSTFLAMVYGLAVEIYLPIETSGLWIYLPLLAVNCLCLHSIRLSASPSERGPEKKGSFGTIAQEATGYLVIACALGAFREACGLGTLTLPNLGSTSGGGIMRIVFAPEPPLRLLAAPAGGFITLGLMTAVYRLALRIRGRRIP